MTGSQLTVRVLQVVNEAANAGVLIVLVLHMLGFSGPWIWAALALSMVGLISFVTISRLLHRQMLRASEAAAQAMNAAKAATEQVGAQTTAVDEMRKELEENRRLQLEINDAKQAAEAATLAKGEFLATMSHEVRTPLNGIIPMLDLLQSSKLTPDQREMLNTALQSSRQLLRIVDDILDYSKLEANRLQLETVSMNLRELLDSVIRLLERQAQAKGLRLALHIEHDVRASFRGDPLRLRQIISNLVSNALKFTERGSVSVHVTRIGESRAHHQLRFEVRDTGVGISPEAASKLFSAFSQADASTTRLYGGTGLGLAICKRIVDLMGGRIGVESELGRGSVFWFEVPMLKAASEMGALRVDLHGARALVLTADDVLKRRFTRAMTHWGVNAVYVDTTHEALARLRGVTNAPQKGFDLFVADLASIKNTVIALHRNLMSMDSAEHLRIALLEGDDPAPPDLRKMPGAILVRRTLPDAELRVKLVGLLAGEATQLAAQDSPAEVNVSRAPSQAPEVTMTAIDRSVPLKGQLLLVEDNPVNLMVAQRLITLTGLHCDTAENGEQALEKLERGHYDVVLMDCQMPVMDGYTATRTWREHEEENQLNRVPIIAMTANAMAGDRQRCIDAGMDDYLSKPVSRELLDSTLRRWLQHAAGERRAAIRQAEQPAPTRAHAVSPLAPATPMQSGFATAAARAPQAAAAVAELPAVAEAQAGPALDSEIVEDLWSAMGESFKDLVGVYLEDAPGHLTKLEAAAAVGDIDSLVAPAHALKSSSANLGAMQVSAIAKLIEHGARARNLGHPIDTVHRLSLEFQRAEVELRKLLH